MRFAPSRKYGSVLSNSHFRHVKEMSETRERERKKEGESFSKVPAIMCTICANKNVTRVEYARRAAGEEECRSYFLGNLFNKKRKINARAVLPLCTFIFHTPGQAAKRRIRRGITKS